MQRDLLLLGEVIEAAERLQTLTAGLTAEDIAEDELRRDAVLWNFTVLGEATGQLSEELRAEHAAVEWRRPAQLRNRIVHGYWSIDLEILVKTAHDDLPSFADAVRSVRVAIESVDQSTSTNEDSSD
jgi:uncharacterized protein with HEPN domain